MTAPAPLCDIQVSDADWAYAEQRYDFGCAPAGPFEAYAFAVFDANREAAS